MARVRHLPPSPHARSYDTPRRLADVRDLQALPGADRYVRAEADPGRVSEAWAGGGALGWVLPSRRVSGRSHVVALGPSEAAVDMLHAVLAVYGEAVGSVSLPRDADRHLTTHTLEPRNDWEWFVTEAAPPVEPAEASVAWLDDGDITEVRALLDRSSPRHDVRPGEPGVRRWCGVRDEDGRLVAVAAHTEHTAGIPHLASIATAPEHRGRGLGAGVTAWLTRMLLAEGAPMVTLGMYSDNDVARRVYERLGYVCERAFTSGRLVRRR